MITWHPNAEGYSASLTVGSVTFARLHARHDAWQIEHHSGIKTGQASSVGYAKRAALQALADLLSKAAFEVDVALRSG